MQLDQYASTQMKNKISFENKKLKIKKHVREFE